MLREELSQFNKNALAYWLYAHSNETPKAYALCQCADDRIGGPENFVKNPMLRFSYSWKPMAGIKICPELDTINNSDAPLDDLRALFHDPVKKETLYKTLEEMFGAKIRQ